MPIGIRHRIGAALSAVVCAAVFGVAAPRSVHAAPAYGSGFIAYSNSSYEWVVLDPVTGEQRTVSPGILPGQIQTLRYSPDARQVAFVALVGGRQQVWVASADGGNAREIAIGGGNRIAWTPDGSRVLFTSDGIESAPADGSSPPVSAVPDPCGRNPQVTARGLIFYERSCSAEQPSMAVYRPGDTASTTVSNTVGVVSPDGSRIARLSMSTPAQTVVSVGETGENTTGWQAATVGEWDAIADFGPTGQIAVGGLTCGICPPRSAISIVADSPGGNAKFIAAAQGSIGFLDWVNGPSNLPTRPVADRVGGTDRIGTAIRASQFAFDTHSDPGRRAAVAVLARDDLYPDALAGTPLAIQKGGPLLLTHGGALDRDVGLELGRVLAPGSTVYLLGGQAALSPAVFAAVRSLGFTPVRLGGADRYATAVTIATAVAGTRPKSVLLATGTDFPDALTAGTAAGQERYSLRGTDAPGGGIVLLTNGRTMPSATLAYLKGLRPSAVRLYAVGGPAAAAMRSAVPRWPASIPLVGSDRYATAADVATSALYGDRDFPHYTVAAVTTGLNFPDAMSGGALAGSQDAPLLLAGPGGLSPAEGAVLRAGGLSNVVVVGGPAAMPDQVLAAAADTAFGPHTWDTSTNRPAPPLR